MLRSEISSRPSQLRNAEVSKDFRFGFSKACTPALEMVLPRLRGRSGGLLGPSLDDHVSPGAQSIQALEPLHHEQLLQAAAVFYCRNSEVTVVAAPARRRGHFSSGVGEAPAPGVLSSINALRRWYSPSLPTAGNLKFLPPLSVSPVQLPLFSCT